MPECRHKAALLILAVWAPVLLASPSGAATSSPPAIAPETAPTLDQKFADFVHDFRATALSAGISPTTYDEAMAHVTRNPRVEQLNAEQPEFVIPVWTYLDDMVSENRITRGRQLLLEEAGVLASIEARFGVSREVLVAIWGDESAYGTEMGSFNMFEALATLAYDGPRTDFGRRELLAALKMVEENHYDPAQMISSWAGAFGQTQFVPSSFLAHAVDGDGDGKIDLWTSPADAMASAAHLLDEEGWKRGGDWGYEVLLPPGFDYWLADLDVARPIADWTAMGVTTTEGGPLRASDDSASIYLPAGARGPAFLVLANFKVLLKYNNAASYALAVSTLSDRFQGQGGIVASWPRDEEPLAPDERYTLQTTLRFLGYDPGKVDGVLGHDSRTAIRSWQRTRGLVPDGFPTKSLLAQLMQDAARKP